MASPELLPGVQGRDATLPAIVTDARLAIHKARRKKMLRDVIDSLLLLALDVFFVSWPQAHVPFFSRESSVKILIALHVAYVTYFIVSRLFPRWRARRISSTWTVEERKRFGN